MTDVARVKGSVGTLRLVVVLGALSLALALATCSAKPDSHQKAAARKAAAIPPVPAPPVQVTVAGTPSGGVWVYHYFVRNGSAFPIAALEIGFNGVMDEPELTLRPKGWEIDSGIPAGNVASPPGWQAIYSPGVEGDSTGTLRWETTDANHEIMGGLSQAAFEVHVSEEDSLYEHAHWTVYLSTGSSASYTGALQPEPITGAGGDVMQRLGQLSISPQPTTGAVKIKFALPSRQRVRVTVFDVQGRLIRELQATDRPAGSQVIAWDGKDIKGKPVSAGVYFVRVKYGEVERFGRMVISH